MNFSYSSLPKVNYTKCTNMEGFLKSGHCLSHMKLCHSLLCGEVLNDSTPPRDKAICRAI